MNKRAVVGNSVALCLIAMIFRGFLWTFYTMITLPERQMSIKKI